MTFHILYPYILSFIGFMGVFGALFAIWANHTGRTHLLMIEQRQRGGPLLITVLGFWAIFIFLGVIISTTVAMCAQAFL